jgi:hypothetical protein
MAREVGVLSWSTIPTGILAGTPSPISEVKKMTTMMGKKIMQKA